jgi:scyllo-inositol 2-dehydrogenase (NADP+)
MINVGIIGYGLSGRYLQAPFFETNENFNLKSIVTNSANPRENFPNVSVLGNVDTLLEDTSIDLISICSPNATHFELAKKVILAGKDVLVEKPITSTIAEAKELYQLAKRQNKTITVFQNRRFDSDFLTVKDVITSGKLGDLLSFEVHFDRYKPILNPKKWKEVYGPSSGILYDLGSHLIDQAISLFGTPKSVSGEKYTQREGSEIDDAFEIRLDYGNLKVTLKSSLMVMHLGPKYVINGTKGSFIKYGMDLQEDHLKMNMQPTDICFGYENESDFGKLYYEKNEENFDETIPTKKGNWMAFFDNLANTISTKTDSFITENEIITQLQVIESVNKV